MSVSESFLQYVIDQLQEVGQVNTRRMFGGVGIYSGGLFFALIANNTLYFKVDSTNIEDFEKLGMKPFKPYKDKNQTMNYYEVPADVLEDRHELAIWAHKAIAVAANVKGREDSRN